MNYCAADDEPVFAGFLLAQEWRPETLLLGGGFEIHPLCIKMPPLPVFCSLHTIRHIFSWRRELNSSSHGIAHS